MKKHAEIRAFMTLTKDLAKYLGSSLVHIAKRQYEKKHGTTLQYKAK